MCLVVITGRDETIPQNCCLVQGQRLGHDYSIVIPSYPLKLEGPKAVPQPNAPLEIEETGEEENRGGGQHLSVSYGLSRE
jgi:hypothetical protein